MDDVITLIQLAVTGHDKYGNEQYDVAERDVFCRVQGVSRNEYYQAAAVNLKPELTVRLSDAKDYFGEKLARYHGEDYSIIRTYLSPGTYHNGADMGLTEIELILEPRIGDRVEDFPTDENGVALTTHLSEFIVAEVRTHEQEHTGTTGNDSE